MIVDDQSFNIFALEAQLWAKGISCDSAISGRAAIELVHKRLKLIASGSGATMYNLILLDYSMPEMDGPMVAKAILDEIRAVKATIQSS